MIGKNLAGLIPAVNDSTTRRNRSHPALQRANVFQHLPHLKFPQRHHIVPNQPHVRICHFRFIQNSLPHITLSIIFMTLLYFRHESRERISVDAPHAHQTQATGQAFNNFSLASLNDNYYRPLHYRYMSEPGDKSTYQVSSNLKLTESSRSHSDTRKKLGDLWCGPWKVIGRTGVLYTLERIQPGTNRKKTRRYHYNLLKYYLPTSDDYLQSSPSKLSENVEATPRLPEQKRNILPPNILPPNIVPPNILPPNRCGEWDYSISD